MAQLQAAQQARLSAAQLVVVNYGHSKYGKTTDLLYSFPNALYIGNIRGLRSAIDVVGWTPLLIKDSMDLGSITTEMRKIRTAKIKNITAVICDDLSLAAKRSQYKLEGSYSGWDLWRELENLFAALILIGTELGFDLGFSAHLREPKINAQGVVTTPGGPDMPTLKMSLELPKHCDLVLRSDPDPLRRPWPVSYSVGMTAHSSWITGDRLGVCPPKSPMNTAEILRAGGREIARAPGVEWIEAFVAAASATILGGAPDIAVLTEYATKLRERGKPDWQIAWFLRDTFDRVEIRKNSPKFQRMQSFGLSL